MIYDSWFMIHDTWFMIHDWWLMIYDFEFWILVFIFEKNEKGWQDEPDCLSALVLIKPSYLLTIKFFLYVCSFVLWFLLLRNLIWCWDIWFVSHYAKCETIIMIDIVDKNELSNQNKFIWIFPEIFQHEYLLFTVLVYLKTAEAGQKSIQP